jgi:predicted nucleic acid-binding protein
MKYVDANIFIYPAIYDVRKDKLAASAKEILVKIADGEIEAATSFLTWDELTWVVRKWIGKSSAVKEGEKFLQFPKIDMVEVDKTVISKAQELAGKYNLKPRDAIHVASALLNGMKEIISDDSDFDVVKEISRIPL